MEEATWLQLYESTTEGTPLSPPLPSVGGLTRWCWEHRGEVGIPKAETPSELRRYLVSELQRTLGRARPKTAAMETLTEEERSSLLDIELLASPEIGDATSKAVRIIDAQAARIAELEAKLADRNLWEPGYSELEERCTELKQNWDACHEQHKDAEEKLAKARQRVSTLEAQVLSSDTVAKAEYQQVVQQRDAMRQELKEARLLLDDALGWLHREDTGSRGDWPEFGALIRKIEALPPFRVV